MMLLSLFVLSACGGGAGGGSQAQDLGTVVMKDEFSFIPKTFDVKPGPVKVILKNEGLQPHDFTIKTLKVAKVVAAGKSETITFDAKTGVHEITCEQLGHKDSGMKGTLTVR